MNIYSPCSPRTLFESFICRVFTRETQTLRKPTCRSNPTSCGLTDIYVCLHILGGGLVAGGRRTLGHGPQVKILNSQLATEF